MHALIASIALNMSLLDSLGKLKRGWEDSALFLSYLPSHFFNKRHKLLPLYHVAVINQYVNLALCFAYFGFLKGIGAFLLNTAMGAVVHVILGPLKWFGVYVYPVLVLILTFVAFWQRP